MRRECPLRKYRQERADTDAEPLYPRFDKFALLSGEKLRHRGRSRERSRGERGCLAGGKEKEKKEESSSCQLTIHHVLAEMS